jgi:two-component system, chemotaxis family, chemotaxis protein CheY
MKILLVDDSGMIRSVEKNFLSELGLNDTVEAADGLLALKAVIAHKIDFIFLDWNMPNLSGIETLKKLKANPATKSIPVVMVTSESEKSHILEAVKIGATSYVIKPFTLEVLKEKLAPFMPLPVVEVPEKSAGETASQIKAPGQPPRGSGTKPIA